LEEKILPVDPRDSKKIGINEYIYEPNPAEILHEIAPKYLKSQVFRLLCESQVSEQAERMNAMNLATTNAGRLLDELTLTYNKLRQAAITSEVSEIVTTVNALKGQ
jgi:F-type H+-transporting ATPase subunit gamma